MPQVFRLRCSLPTATGDTIQLAHGGGGRMMHSLIERLFLPAFSNSYLEARHDSAVVRIGNDRIAFTTDTYVVSPLFFPGGDIGKLAVYGTVNDLAMAGARPLYLSAGFILEEGLPLETLEAIVRSMREAAGIAGVELVAGDTKVVDRGKGDGVFINTAGIGLVAPEVDISPARVAPGDAILLSGDVGRHGITIMSLREGLGFETPLQSDCASLWPLIAALLEARIEIHCLRDLTRGGLASTLNEIATDAGVGISIDEAAVPKCEAVAAACEILGLDPLYVANEGRFAAFIAPRDASRAIEILKAHETTASIIGTVGNRGPGLVDAKGPFGHSRILDLLSGEQMPRIC